MPDRIAALDQALAALELARAAVLAARSDDCDDPWIPLKEFVFRTGLSEEAARKRAKRGAGEKINGRICFRRSYLDTYLQGRMSS